MAPGMSRPTTATRPPLQTRPTAKASLSLGEIGKSIGNRVLIYGVPGVGKSTLSASAPGPIAFFDFDQSLPVIRSNLDRLGLTSNVRVVQNVNAWETFVGVLAGAGWDNVATIVIDPVGIVEQMASDFVIRTIPKEKGGRAKDILDFGWGSGFRHMYDSFVSLLAILDMHRIAGRHVIFTSHVCDSEVSNATGEMRTRFEPRLYTSGRGTSSIRCLVTEWADHVLFLDYDVTVSTDGKSRGSGSATMYPTQLPHFMAKSRSIQCSMPLESCYTDLWKQLLV